MLELRLNCEHCNKDLPYNSTEAMICSFECTYCSECALELFKNICPSCGGNFEKRPLRPKAMIKKYPPSNKRVYKPKDIKAVELLIEKYKNTKPEHR
ncbi:DUF1272 domain-containing protein [Flagellimonas sp. HMM57]|uniref:DUF1272 domain-containing protein n=1 Tax=unclassified Flagellimonas TaxID=2644544 RepID=UPI0013D4BCF2|nr:MULTISPECIES: DUF1272 domain-containing protein [unclassified Flagellimonas]UII77789.1 DUF1272 domain-containing protein [Flagellimonas sp. HMM57]